MKLSRALLCLVERTGLALVLPQPTQPHLACAAQLALWNQSASLSPSPLQLVVVLQDIEPLTAHALSQRLQKQLQLPLNVSFVPASASAQHLVVTVFCAFDAEGVCMSVPAARLVRALSDAAAVRVVGLVGRLLLWLCEEPQVQFVEVRHSLVPHNKWARAVLEDNKAAVSYALPLAGLLGRSSLLGGLRVLHAGGCTVRLGLRVPGEWGGDRCRGHRA